MPNAKDLYSVTQCISILLFDQFSNHCLANILEPLRACNHFTDHEYYRWNIVTLTGNDVVSSSGLRLAADARLSDVQGDMLMVMPSYEFVSHATVTCGQSLRAAARKFDRLAGLDTGSWLLAEAGLLDGYRATIHWDEIDLFSERFTDVLVEKDPVIFDRDRVSCGGASTAFAMALQLIGQALGSAIMFRVEALFTGAYSERPDPKAGIVARAINLMRRNIEEPLLIAEIAKDLERSQRHLETQMQEKMGASPQTIYRRLRLSHARGLVADTDMSVSEIALRSGYNNASAMTRAFRAEFRVTPQDIRRARN